MTSQREIIDSKEKLTLKGKIIWLVILIIGVLVIKFSNTATEIFWRFLR